MYSNLLGCCLVRTISNLTGRCTSHFRHFWVSLKPSESLLSQFACPDKSLSRRGTLNLQVASALIYRQIKPFCNREITLTCKLDFRPYR